MFKERPGYYIDSKPPNKSIFIVRGFSRRLVISIATTVTLGFFLPVSATQKEQEVNALFGPRKSPDGFFLADISREPSFDEKLLLKSTRDGHILWSYPQGRLNTILGIAWSPDSKKIAVAADRVVRVLDASNGHEIYIFDGIKGGDAFAPNWSRDGKYIVAIGTKSGNPAFSRCVIAWDASTQKTLVEISGRPGSRVLWAPDSKRIAFNTDEHNVQIWDALGNKELTTILINGGGRPPFDWSPDGRYIVVADWQFSEAVVYVSETGKPLTKHPFKGQISELSWSKDGKSISCKLRNGPIQNWQLQHETNGLIKAEVIKQKVLGERGYMPATLAECFTQLNVELDAALIKKIKEGTENDLGQYHFFLEMWIRNRFDLRGHSKLAQSLESIGVKEAENMSELILHSYWRMLNNLPLNTNERTR